VFILLCLQVQAQSITYKVTWRGDSIGYLRAEKDRSGPFVTYELKSETAFSFLLSYSMQTQYHSVYKEGQLLTASTKNFVNDKQKDHSQIKYLDNAYQIEVNDKSRKDVLKIDESIATLYFAPPKGNSIFSERFGEKLTITKSGGSSYDLIKPDKRVNTYFYKNGVCERVKINLALASIELIKIK
jgi:hypothetical protein